MRNLFILKINNYLFRYVIHNGKKLYNLQDIRNIAPMTNYVDINEKQSLSTVELHGEMYYEITCSPPEIEITYKIKLMRPHRKNMKQFIFEIIAIIVMADLIPQTKNGDFVFNIDFRKMNILIPNEEDVQPEQSINEFLSYNNSLAHEYEDSIVFLNIFVCINNGKLFTYSPMINTYGIAKPIKSLYASVINNNNYPKEVSTSTTADDLKSHMRHELIDMVIKLTNNRYTTKTVPMSASIIMLLDYKFDIFNKGMTKFNHIMTLLWGNAVEIHNWKKRMKKEIINKCMRISELSINNHNALLQTLENDINAANKLPANTLITLLLNNIDDSIKLINNNITQMEELRKIISSRNINIKAACDTLTLILTHITENQ